jgi:arginine decarboxylase
MDVRVAWGTGSGPTELASYDAALAEAGAHEYNLIPVSSVLPADADVTVAGTATDLGPAGARLTVVQARVTATGPGHVSAALGWAAGDCPGIVYEAAGEFEEADARERVARGLAAGRDLRDWDFSEEGLESVTAPAEPGTYTTAVVLAILGEGEPLA